MGRIAEAMRAHCCEDDENDYAGAERVIKDMIKRDIILFRTDAPCDMDSILLRIVKEIRNEFKTSLLIKLEDI
jgi:hypothetical protein